MESLGMKYDELVSVVSKPITQAEKVGKFPTLLITKRHDSLVNEVIQKITSPAEAEALYGINTSVSAFAKNYFNFQNRLGDFPDLLHVYTWAHDKGQNASLIGNNTPELDDLKKVNGKFKLTIDSTTKEITLDLTQKNSHTEMAEAFKTAIQTNNNAVNGFKDAEVKWSSIYNAFIIIAGAGASVIHPLTAGSNDDISGKLGLTAGEGARSIKPYNKIDDILDALTALKTRNDSYVIITFDFEFESFKDVDAVADWVNETRGDYLILYVSSKGEIKSQPTFSSHLHKYSGFMLEYSNNLRQTNGRSAGALSSMDLSKVNGNINVGASLAPDMYNTSIKLSNEYDIITNVDKNRANCYVTFKDITSPRTMYQPGNIMGYDTPHVNVYLSNRYIKASLQDELAEWLARAVFPSTQDTPAIELILHTVMQRMRASNLISTLDSKGMDELEKLQVRPFVTNVETVDQALKNDGYFINVAGYDAQTRCMNVNLIYVSNVPIRKICIRLMPLRSK